MYEKSSVTILGVGLRTIFSSPTKSIAAFVEISVSETEFMVEGYPLLYLSLHVQPSAVQTPSATRNIEEGISLCVSGRKVRTVPCIWTLSGIML